MKPAEALELWKRATMRPFTRGDFDAFAGVESVDPKIGEIDGYTLIEDGDAVEVYDVNGDRLANASKPEPEKSIDGEAEMVEALRYVLDDMDAQEIVKDAGLKGMRLDTFEDAGLMTSNAGIVIRLPNGAEFQVQIVQSRNARPRG